MKNLNDITKNNAFNVPENYFDTFAAELEARISEENLKNQFGNRNFFSVPENYFKNFKVQMNPKKGKIIQLIKPWLSAAAGIIIIFALWQFLLTDIINTNKQAQNHDSLQTNNSTVIANNTLSIDDIDIKYLDPEINAYIDEADANTIYEYTDDSEQETVTNTDDETIYEYYIDYADDNDITELLADL
ncbi:MAG: hypothetical protein DRI94_05805 [Bacteroidetes bacterium]|nr:MAG: hypothetical protein DRI94_05805 [Bacteroidota bacterium]